MWTWDLRASLRVAGFRCSLRQLTPVKKWSVAQDQRISQATFKQVQTCAFLRNVNISIDWIYHSSIFGERSKSRDAPERFPSLATPLMVLRCPPLVRLPPREGTPVRVLIKSPLHMKIKRLIAYRISSAFLLIQPELPPALYVANDIQSLLIAINTDTFAHRHHPRVSTRKTVDNPS